MEEKLGEAIGKDFLFLFDLIAENFGKVSMVILLQYFSSCHIFRRQPCEFSLLQTQVFMLFASPTYRLVDETNKTISKIDTIDALGDAILTMLTTMLTPILTKILTTITSNLKKHHPLSD